ncbi:hypothetical protein TNCT_686101 [Trichonephila clavata]|uniref:Uncharacterized protein n=1 Tax=Trichonephila clavata TaxID=2740835 RepID=A0A8X6M1D6_TRICU|nr:hypothetical protein TNCT_686101 [Trichonephila clavata]
MIIISAKNPFLPLNAFFTDGKNSDDLTRNRQRNLKGQLKLLNRFRSAATPGERRVRFASLKRAHRISQPQKHNKISGCLPGGGGNRSMSADKK